MANDAARQRVFSLLVIEHGNGRCGDSRPKRNRQAVAGDTALVRRTIGRLAVNADFADEVIEISLARSSLTLTRNVSEGLLRLSSLTLRVGVKRPQNVSDVAAVSIVTVAAIGEGLLA
jgi:hypothetical protein